MSAPTEATITPADDDLTTEVALAPEPPTIGPSGWRRMLLGLLVGLAAGALLALVLPRRDPEPVGSVGAASTEPDARGPVAGGAGGGHEVVAGVAGVDDDDAAAR